MNVWDPRNQEIQDTQKNFMNAKINVALKEIKLRAKLLIYLLIIKKENLNPFGCI